MEQMKSGDTAKQKILPPPPIAALLDVRNRITIPLDSFAGSRVTLGRSETCTIPVTGDRLVSSLHCAIDVAEDLTCTIRDCGSTNGTLFNSVPLRSERDYPLRPSTTLTIGERKFLALSPDELMALEITADQLIRSLQEKG